MFELCWEGKSKAKASADSLVKVALEPFDDAQTLNPNILIEGDNLHGLRALRTNFLNHIDCIYIDPPYNTGNQFIYNDDFSRAGKAKTSSGIEQNLSNSANRHTVWLNMMYPRLCIAKELLSETGVLFISIDDVAVAPLRLILDEIFGMENYVQTFLWLHGKGKKDKHSRTQHQYILCVAKNRSSLPSWSQLVTKTYTKISNPDQDPRGPWFSGSISFSEQRSNPSHPNFFTIQAPSGVTWTRQWLCSEDELSKHIQENNIYFGGLPAQNNVPRLKIFSHEADIIPLNVLDDLGTTRSAIRSCAEAFDGSVLFDYPKPVALIQHLLQLACPTGGRILDFFAGSGTTGVASMRLSSESKTNYPCILIQKPDAIDRNRFADRIAWCENAGIKPHLGALCWHRLHYESPNPDLWQRFRCVVEGL